MVPLRTRQTHVPTCRHTAHSGLRCSASTSMPGGLCRGPLGMRNIKHTETDRAIQPYGEPEACQVGASPEKSAHRLRDSAMALTAWWTTLGSPQDREASVFSWGFQKQSVNKAAQVRNFALGAFTTFQRAAIIPLFIRGKVKIPLPTDSD